MINNSSSFFDDCILFSAPESAKGKRQSHLQNIVSSQSIRLAAITNTGNTIITESKYFNDCYGSNSEGERLNHIYDMPIQPTPNHKRKVDTFKNRVRSTLAGIEKDKIYNTGTLIDVAKIETELGYTRQQFRQHIEAQFDVGMSWRRGERKLWHVDHIKPLSAFIHEGVTDIKIINALSNLRPLWAVDNMKKGSSYTE